MADGGKPARDAITAINQALAAPVYVKTFHGGKPWPLHPALVQERFVDIEAAYGDIYAAQRAELKAALEQPAPVQEPVAFFDPQGKGFYWAKPTKITAPVTVDVKPLPLYTTPPAAPVQPAAWESEMRSELAKLGFEKECPESIGITIKRWFDAYAESLTAQPAPVPCCGKYETCTQACTPRGKFLGTG